MVASPLPELLSEIMPVDEEMAEFALLLPRWQAKALQDAADAQGISSGRFLRRLLEQHLPSREPKVRWVDFG